MISSNVKRLMAAKGLTNQTLAARAHISADTVARTKSERIRECSLDTLISIAQALGVQTKDLYCESLEIQAGSERGAEPSLLAIELGILIKKKRLSIPKVTQKKLALQSGLEQAYLSKIERGLLQPSLDELIRLAQRINTTASHLLKQVEAAESQKHVSHASKNKFL